MGYEAENEVRRAAFAKRCVSAEMMTPPALTPLFMHRLPAHRGEVVTADVIDGPNPSSGTRVENRMHGA